MVIFHVIHSLDKSNSTEVLDWHDVFDIGRLASSVLVLSIISNNAYLYGLVVCRDERQNLAYCRDRTVWVLGASGRERKVGDGFSPTVSPDGNLVAYASLGSKADESRTIQLSSLDGRAHVLSVLPSDIKAVQWSPVSSLLAVLTYGGGKQELWTVAVPPTGRVRASRLALNVAKNRIGGIYMPRWYPDGRSLVFQDINRVYRVNLSGEILEEIPLEKLTGSRTNVDSLASFVANPLRLEEWAYVAMVPGTKKFDHVFGEPCPALFTINRKSGQRKRLTPIDMVANDPVWSRDGGTLYFVGYREAHYRERTPFRIFRVNRDGTGLAEVKKGEQPST